MSNPWKRKEVIGDCTLYLGDCMEVMPTLGKVDAVVTDPPYGINANKQTLGSGKKDFKRSGDWDIAPPTKDLFLLVHEKSGHQIIWGGNYFSNFLSPTNDWLVWHKKNDNLSFSECELAWTNLKKQTRHISHHWGGEKKEHPTQKPLAVMEWCIGHLPKDTETILDPFMGSGTTLVACAKLGRSGIGVELDPDYFDIACERVEKAYQQTDLFVAPPENTDIKRNQINMFDDGDAA